MMRKSATEVILACAACLSALLTASASRAADPPYTIVLRSRDAAVTPVRSRDAQTGGGFIQVTQVEPNVVMTLMRGAVAAGAGHKGETASMQFHLHQDFEIVPTRSNLRPPRLIVTAWAIGSLQSTLKEGGSADHGPACAAVLCGPNPVLNLCIKPHSVGCGESLLVNDRVGPLEAVVEPGGFCLDQTFAINANQPKTHCHPGSAAADFDPDPRMDTQWNEVLKPFRAVPHKDFGFRVILRVIEEPPPPGVPVAPAPPVETLPPPKPEKKVAPVLDPNTKP
jgi:hypothetical protein